MTPVTLVVGGLPLQRETAIAARLAPGRTAAVILEGLPSGKSPFDLLQQQAAFTSPAVSSPLPAPPLRIVRIAPGCPCCTGNLTMRVTLNRLLRRPPDHLYISLSSSAHLEQVRAFLSQEPYVSLMLLTKDCRVDWHS